MNPPQYFLMPATTLSSQLTRNNTGNETLPVVGVYLVFCYYWFPRN